MVIRVGSDKRQGPEENRRFPVGSAVLFIGRIRHDLLLLQVITFTEDC